MGIWDIVKKAADVARNTLTNPLLSIANAPKHMINHIVNSANRLDEMPRNISLFIQAHGDGLVTEIIVFREPVMRAVRHAMTVLTLGKLSVDIRHVFEVFVLQSSDGKKTFVRMEKNQTVEAIIISESTLQTLYKTHEYRIVRLKEFPVTLKKYFKNYVTNTDQKTLWVYDPVTSNCQVFVYLGLLCNGATNAEAQESFIVQPEVRAQLVGIAHTITRGITTIANYGRRVLSKRALDDKEVFGNASSFYYDDGGLEDMHFEDLLLYHHAQVLMLESMLNSLRKRSREKDE
jgi:hypothetical protein